MSGTTPDDTPDPSKPNVFRPEGEVAVELLILIKETLLKKTVKEEAERAWYEATYAFWNRAKELKLVETLNEDTWHACTDRDDQGKVVGVYFVKQESLRTMLRHFSEMKKAAVQVQHYEFASECRNLERMLKQALDWQDHHFAMHDEEARRREKTCTTDTKGQPDVGEP